MNKRETHNKESECDAAQSKHVGSRSVPSVARPALAQLCTHVVVVQPKRLDLRHSLGFVVKLVILEQQQVSPVRYWDVIHLPKSRKSIEMSTK